MNLRPVYELTRVAIEIARRMIIRWYITAATVLVAIMAVIYYARHEGAQYVTTMKVVPAEMMRDESTPTASSTLGGAASLFGISLGGGSGGRIGLYLDLLQSPAVAQGLIDHEHFDKTFFQGAVDPKTGEFLPSFQRKRTALIYRLFGLRLPNRPSVQDLAGYLQGAILINHDAVNPNIIILKCRSGDPAFCPKFLLMVHRETQTILNSMTLDAAKTLAAYLTQTLPNVSSIEARAAMTAALANAEKDIAFASTNQPNVAAVLEGPVEPTSPVFPNPPEMLTLAVILGILAGGVVTWFTWGLRFETVWSETNARIRALYPRALL